MEKEIYAKSNPRITLKQHVADGLRILECLKECFPKIPDLAGSHEFWDWIRLSILLHDTGKAHADFQDLLASKPNNWNRQRHELFSLSFIFACLTEHEALEQISRVVAGHHKPMNSLLHHIRTEYEDPPSEFERQFRRVDVQSVLEMLRDHFYMTVPDEVQVVHPRAVVSKYCQEIRSESVTEKHQLLLMTGAFKQCDHLSSAFIERIEPLSLDRFSFLDQKHAKLQSEGKDFFSHQKSAARQLGSAIVTAPTGSGKTETALLWVRNQMQNFGQGRVFYVLPFTASINAMWQRLHHETDGFGEAHVGMLHGNLDAVLYERLFEETGDTRLIGQKIKDVKSAFQSLETPIKVVTPFQLLKHIFGLKGFEKGIFEMSGGYFIFDEIHAYDPAVFAQIIVLLEYAMQKLDVRTLVMTATLPGFLKTELRRVAEFSEIIADDALYERFKRHRLIVLSGGISDGMDRIARDLIEGQRVLVVCNTVLQAQQMFDNRVGDMMTIKHLSKFC
ncbi:MAG: CRISPR-associated helicase Cas3' [Saprospiraceae bacterium]